MYVVYVWTLDLSMEENKLSRLCSGAKHFVSLKSLGF